MVAADALQVPHIIEGDVIIQVGFPESLQSVGTDQLMQQFIDLSRRIDFTHFEHIAFRNEPVTQVDPLQHDFVTRCVHQFCAFCPDKTGPCTS